MSNGSVTGATVPPIIYNLFPTLVGPAPGWVAHAARAAAMGFTWLYLNPIHYPGFSGSLYAIKEHFRLHPVLSPTGDGASGSLPAIAPAIQAIREQGLHVMLDLVVNHTARDSPLVERHPSWFRRDTAGRVVSPSAVDPDDARRVTVWGDLAEVDNATSPDREALWAFWERLVEAALDLGFSGFRCDAAYKVPTSLWRRLVTRARARAPGTVFVAETLGCAAESVEALATAGFDYFYNSSKWWDGVARWCLDQHESFRRIAPSIAFPESHDTPRLASESRGSETVQRQRYALAAVFSGGVQMPIGFEFGFERRLDVVATRPDDWEEPRFDIGLFIRQVNRLKLRHPLLAGEGVLRRLDWKAPDVTTLRRWSDAAGTHRGVVLMNRSTTTAAAVTVDPAELAPVARLFRLCRDSLPPRGDPLPPVVRLDPAELALLADPVGA